MQTPPFLQGLRLHKFGFVVVVVVVVVVASVFIEHIDLTEKRYFPFSLYKYDVYSLRMSSDKLKSTKAEKSTKVQIYVVSKS